MNLINYVIDLSSLEFLNEVLKYNKESNVSEKVQEVYNLGFYEGELFEEYIDIEVSGGVCVFTLGVKYGWFLSDEIATKRVVDFERKLLCLIHEDCSVIRTNDSAVEEYSVELKNDFWFNQKDAFSLFYKWVSTQDEYDWKKLI